MVNSSKRLRRNLVVSTCLAAASLSLPMLAYAGEAAAVTAAGPSQVTEVIVTAERRSVNLQKSPLAISSVEQSLTR